MRQEARELTRKLQEAGKTPEVAYEEAWNQVYTRNRLNANGGEGDKRLNSLLRHLVEGNQNPELVDKDAQWLLEALMEDDSRLDSEEGRLLLRKLLDHLRASSLVQPQEQFTTQDELMLTFANALASGKDSMDAYRDALFKVNRGRIMNHPMVGYYAPWGLGLGRSKAVYQQAKNPIPSQTISSANTQAQTVPFENLHVGGDEKQTSENISAGLDPDAGKVENFLATSPELKDDEEEKDEPKDNELLTDEQEAMGAAAPVNYAQPMRLFAMRSAAPVTLAAAAAPVLTWTGSGSTTWVAGSSVTPWTMNGSATSFQNGYNVLFNGNGGRDVTISGIVAPGLITVNADPSGSSGGIVKEHSIYGIIGSLAKDANAVIRYGYAFTGSGCIADVSANSPTSIINEGGSILVLNTSNTFSGGVTVQNGALYLGCANAAGTGVITLNNNATWEQRLNSGTTSTEFKSIYRKGTELIVNYNSAASDYRTPHVNNPLNLQGSSGGTVRVSFGYASYGETKLPNEWRNVTLAGGVYGTGNLELYGYSYATDLNHNYVSSFTINKSALGVGGDSALSAFSGTVTLHNQFNHSAVADRNFVDYRLLPGAVQLVLSDDVFANAVVNLTRELNSDKTVGNDDLKYVIFGSTVGESGKAVTSDNILVLQGDVALRGLEAKFHEGDDAWRHKPNNFISSIQYTWLDSTNQDSERWRVRVVTSGQTTLTLSDNTAGAEHVYSGSMGFAQSYVNDGQGYVCEFSGDSDSDASFSVGGGSLGTETLSLTKSGQATQYIHSAKLNTLSLQQGTLGFNNLSLSGYLNLTSGSRLELGVTSAAEWNNISNMTSSSLTIQSGKELLVIAANGGNETVTVAGSLTMATGSDIMFSVLRPELGSTASESLLQITGSLTLGADVPINVNFTSVEFAKNSAGKTYYLISADKGITINGKDASNFQTRYIPLGNGYYGILNTKNSSSVDYLVMTVSGDPRRTWSGNVGDKATSKGIWTAATTDAIDYTWKENHNFLNGEVVLFGNLYQPTAWSEGEWGASSTNTTIVGDKSHPGTTGKVAIDGIEYSDFQLVEIIGEVRPVSVAINADYLRHDVELEDGTNYYFYGSSGSIGDAENGEIKLPNFVQGSEEWQTYLRKGGTGTAVIATANTFSGGTSIEGGRIVMQNAAALGTGGITIQNGAILQGDFADNPSSVSGSPSYQGEQMVTTTISNPLYVAIYITEDGTISSTDVDGFVMGAHDKKLVLSSLSGGAETVLTLMGNSADSRTSTSKKYTYSVFKVLDPGSFYGTVKMDGNLMGRTGDGGKVQMEIMTTEKAAEDGNWLNTKIDLSVDNGTERTVLALDALGSSGAAGQQTALVDSLHGSSKTSGRMNSSVLSMSKEKQITLQLMGSTSGSYQGVLGFGDFQKTVDYSGAVTGDIGSVQHHFGRAGSAGALSVLKSGASTQSVNSAWLDKLIVADGRFIVDEALVVNSLQVEHGKHLSIGQSAGGSSYAVSVGRGGILAVDNERAADAFANIGGGIAAYTVQVPDPESSNGATIDQAVAPSLFVLFDNGATITGFGDWYTYGPSGSASVSVAGKNTSISYTVGIDIATGATVTFNTHNYTPDEYITASNDEFGRYNSSHAIQLLGAMKGSNVNLIFNNELISAAAVKDGSAKKRTDGLGYDGVTGTQMGYVAIRDIHQFTGDITVEGMTVLQVRDANASANASSADIDVTVQGRNAGIQFTNDATTQYMNKVSLADGGHVLIGGALKSTTGSIAAMDMTGVDAAVTHRTADEAHVNNLNLANSGTSVSMGGFDDIPSTANNARISSLGATTEMTLHDMNLQGSLVQLHDACALNLTDAVLVDAESVVQGDLLATSGAEVGEFSAPAASTGQNVTTTSSATKVELTFSDYRGVYDVGDSRILVLQAEQFQGVDVTGNGLTLQLTADSKDFQSWGYWAGAEYVAVQIGGGSGRFLFEEENSKFADLIDKQFVLLGADGKQIEGYWVTSAQVSADVGVKVTPYMLYFMIPEPTTATLSLAALVALMGRRRRKN